MVTTPAERALVAVLAAAPESADLVAVRQGGAWVVGVEPDEVVTAGAETAFAALEAIDRAGGWWAGFLGYDLGRAVERVAPRRPDGGDGDPPEVCFARFDCRLVLDGTRARVVGRGPSRPGLRALARRAERARPGALGEPDLGGWRSSATAAEYAAAVRAALELIAAGDCFQVNLARRLSCPQPAEARSLFAALVNHHPAPHAALVRVGPWTVASGSPERFLRRSGRSVQTRPVKGTSTDPAFLAASAKDRAENVMIVDLARNDLGRVCEYGSVRAPELCRVEAHPGLYHLVSTVEGTLREGVGTASLVRATFPPASVTGAPKPRVLQAIEDLEPVRRGVYCGAVGWIDADRAALDLNVAIRTFVVSGGATHLGVGAGIVADSEPEAEWRETELKAARLLAAAGSSPGMRSTA